MVKTKLTFFFDFSKVLYVNLYFCSYKISFLMSRKLIIFG